MEMDPKQLEMMQSYLKEFREDLAEALAKQVEASQLKTQYLDVLSHQFRTPLTGIRFCLEMIRENKDFSKWDEEMQQMIIAAHEDTVKLVGILNDVALAQEIEKDTLFVRKEEISLQELVEEVVSELESIREGKEIELGLSGEDAQISVDQHKLKHTLTHLLRNAYYYSKPGSKVSLEFGVEDGDLQVKVSDEGVGIPTDDQNHIFDRFFRGSNASIMFTDSSGLGLYIAKKFVEAHDGMIDFESSEGEGSAFIINIAA